MKRFTYLLLSALTTALTAQDSTLYGTFPLATGLMKGSTEITPETEAAIRNIAEKINRIAITRMSVAYPATGLNIQEKAMLKALEEGNPKENLLKLAARARAQDWGTEYIGALDILIEEHKENGL